MTPRVELVRHSGEAPTLHAALVVCARAAVGRWDGQGEAEESPTFTCNRSPAPGCLYVHLTYPDDTGFTLLVDLETWQGALRLALRG